MNDVWRVLGSMGVPTWGTVEALSRAATVSMPLMGRGSCLTSLSCSKWSRSILTSGAAVLDVGVAGEYVDGEGRLYREFPLIFAEIPLSPSWTTRTGVLSPL